jgi:hypothetical protein
MKSQEKFEILISYGWREFMRIVKKISWET